MTSDVVVLVVGYWRTVPGKQGGAVVEGGAGWVQKGRFAVVDKDPV